MRRIFFVYATLYDEGESCIYSHVYQHNQSILHPSSRFAINANSDNVYDDVLWANGIK